MDPAEAVDPGHRRRSGIESKGNDGLFAPCIRRFVDRAANPNTMRSSDALGIRHSHEE